MNEYRANAERILLSYYIKYDKLIELTDAAFRGNNSNIVNIYIDLYDMVQQLYNPTLYSNKEFIIASSIINLAAHYRSFFWTRYRTMTRIFLVYGNYNATDNHRKFYPLFGDSSIQMMNNFDKINDSIISQLQMVKFICGYINDVYYIGSNYDFSLFTYNNICIDPIPSILITKSKYAYQIPALTDAVIYRPKKFGGDDNSYLVTSANVITSYFKITRESSNEKIQRISPSLLSALITLSGMPSRKLMKLFSSTTAINKIYNAVSNNRIINNYNSDIDYLYNQLDINGEIDSMNFKYRFNAIDLVFQHRMYINSVESRDRTWCININNKQDMHEINNKYFANNPLDLESL